MNTFQILKQVCSLIDKEIESSMHKQVAPYKKQVSAEKKLVEQALGEFNILREKIKHIEAYMAHEGIEVGPIHSDIITSSLQPEQLTISKDGVPVEVLDTPLCDLTYYQGALKPLRYAGITHIKDLIYKSDKELLKIKNFGVGKLHVVRKSVEDYFTNQHQSDDE